MITKEAAYKKIAELVERFEMQFDSYKNVNYNETLTRRDFIDPFFKALGWDVDNEEGYAESYREVIHEDRVKIGKTTKSPDYSFKLSGGKRLFFVEAKKPSVVVKDDIIAAYQVRRYGWNAKLPISIITDFEEFAVYDCTRKPNPTDKASIARIEYFTFRDYPKKFDFLWNTFSKEQVLKGSFDKYVKDNSNKKGTTTVDKEFLMSLDSWRTYLATSISWNNKNLGEDEINFVVQQTLDRIIFLRIAEDRNIEPPDNLKSALAHGNYYHNLFAIFAEADAKYNSGLFDFNKDQISKEVKVDNKVIKTIVKELYYPSPYAFNAMPVEILGTAYEQFLGKVIRITPGHRAKIEEKPEVRKAGGVYYTPQYIVDYIVKNTVGKLVEGKVPKEVSDLKIVDPACGSGSFLIGAYQYLLDWHTDYYTNFGKLSKGAKDNPLTPQGNLTTGEKKRILLNNIYGVDIDVNAVEVTKLSLLLKCMEGETDASIDYQRKMFHERVLPTLDNNIKDGNSLVDTDIYGSMLDFGEEKKIKPFCWDKAFPEVFTVRVEEPHEELRNIAQKAKQHATKALQYVSELEEKLNTVQEPTISTKPKGGFDVVIGNPPYLGGREWKEENGNVYDYFIGKYKVAEYQFDIYALFWEAGIKLLRSNGLIGYITPNTWLNNQSNKKLRSYILGNASIKKIVDYSKIKVFEQATVLPIITILEKRVNNQNIAEIFEPAESGFRQTQCVNQEIWNDGDLSIININLSQRDLLLRDKIEGNSLPLEKLALIKFGIKVYQTGKGRPKQSPDAAINKIFESKTKETKEFLQYLKGKDINKYSYHWNGDWLHYGKHLAEPRIIDLFQGERLLVRRIVGETLIATYLNNDMVTGQLLQIVKPYNPTTSKFLLGIINSKLMAYYFRKKYNRQDKTFPEIRIYELASLPIKQPDETNGTLKSDIEKYVDQLIKLNSELSETKLHSQVTHIKGKIDYCEDEVNRLVYQLYGIIDKDEMNIIEEK